MPTTYVEAFRIVRLTRIVKTVRLMRIFRFVAPAEKGIRPGPYPDLRPGPDESMTVLCWCSKRPKEAFLGCVKHDD